VTIVTVGITTVGAGIIIRIKTTIRNKNDSGNNNNSRNNNRNISNKKNNAPPPMVIQVAYLTGKMGQTDRHGHARV
jgi:hypothetical protein